MTLCSNNTPSTNEYTGNGAITEYSITFQYYSQSDIFVAFYDTAAEAWVSVSNSNWSFLNPTVIKFNTAPADNQRILIYRCTDIDPLPAEFFPGNSIKAADLNNNFFVMKSAIEEINTQSGSSDTLAQSAKATADAANAKADTAIATANTADTNATTAVNTANTATSTANTANTTANAADTKADTAITTANSASTAAGTALTNSQTAISTANTAATDASSAVTTANAADTKADTAISTANTASTNASSAVTTANSADTNATTALNAANSATSTANTALSTANTANTTANTANTTANTANTAATAASSDASAAVSSANAAVTTANTADTNATTALNTANSVAGVANTANTNATNAVNTANTALSTANTANTTANNANTTANNALNQVAAASPWSENSGVVSLVNSGSSVGVGTSSPSRKLEVAGHLGVVGGGNVYLQNGARVQYGTSNATSVIGQDGSNGYLLFGVGNEVARFTSNGNFGIGTSNPSTLLDVRGAGNPQIKVSATNTGTNSAGLYIENQGQRNWQIWADRASDQFRIGNNSRATTNLAITAGVGVGIGEDNPDTTLHVSGGAITLDSKVANGHSRGIFFHDGTNFGQQIRNSTGGFVATTYAVENNNSGAVAHKWYTGPSERLRISSSGNLGVNTSTPPAKLTVTAGASGTTAYAGRSLNYGALVHTVSGRSGYIVQNTNSFTTANDNAGFQWLYPFDSGGDSNYKVFRSAVGATLADKFWVNQGGGAYFADHVGIGNTNPADYDTTSNNLVVGEAGSGDRGITIASGTSHRGTVMFADGTSGLGEYAGYLQYNHNGNYLAIATNNSEALRITSNSRLGIGTSSPKRRLHVNHAAGDVFTTITGDTNSYAGVLLGNQADDARGQVIYNNLDNSLYFVTNNSGEKLRITSNGNCGIGTSNPGAKLHVKGTDTGTNVQLLRFQNPSSSNLYLEYADGADANSDWKFRTGSQEALTFQIGGDFIVSTSGSEAMRISSNGSVGIGASNPSAGLIVRGSDQNAPGVIYDNGGTGGFIKAFGMGSSPFAGGGVLFGAEQSYSAGSLGFAAIKGLLTDGGGNTRGDLSFYTRSSASSTQLTQRMRIDHNGTVAITGSLTVNGQSVATGNIAEAPTDGQQYARQNAAWSVVSSSSGYVNVKDFGAVGNGTTDDTTAVRNALNGGGTVYFPKGTYRITSTLNHTSAFNVVGDGQQSRIMFDASSNNSNLFNLETNVRHNNAKKWSFSSIALSCKAVANRIHAAGIRIAYTGPATVIGGTNYLELNDVHIVSEITTDATQAYFRYGLSTVNIGGIVADNLNISTFNANAENDSSTIGIYIQNNISGHAVIRAFTGNNIYLQRYYQGLHATKAGGGQNIESIYMTQGEIVCKVGIHLAASHATFISGMHIECQKESYINSSDGGPHRVVGCDLRGGRNGTQNLTDYLIKIGVDNCSFTGNYITAQMPSAGCIRTGGSTGNPDNVSIVGNIFNGNGSSTYRALSCESGSVNVIFTGNLGSGFGGNSNPVFNQIGTGQGKLNNTANEFQ
jgi:hypothetical protein